MSFLFLFYFLGIRFSRVSPRARLKGNGDVMFQVLAQESKRSNTVFIGLKFASGSMKRRFSEAMRERDIYAFVDVRVLDTTSDS